MLFSLGLFFQLLVMAASEGEFECPIGWAYSPSSGTCLAMMDGKATWALANALCQEFGGNLVSIPNAEKFNFMNDNFRGYDTDRYWIGLNDRTCEGKFRWRRNNGTDVQFHYSNWGPLEPKNHDATFDCVSVGKYENQGWSTDNCTRYQGYLCQKTEEEVKHYRDCPVGWKYYHMTRKCLRLFHDKKQWYDAVKACMSHSAILAKITDAGLKDFIAAHFSGTEASPFWIGLNDQSYEGSYRWRIALNKELESEFLAWYPEQPNNWLEQQDCAAVGHKDGLFWTDDECSNKYKYVCETAPYYY